MQTDTENFESVKAAVYIFYGLHQLYPEQMEWRTGRMDGLWKTPTVREQLLEGKEPEEIIGQWEAGLEYFQKVRKQYLIY